MAFFTSDYESANQTNHNFYYRSDDQYVLMDNNEYRNDEYVLKQEFGHSLPPFQSSFANTCARNLSATYFGCNSYNDFNLNALNSCFNYLPPLETPSPLVPSFTYTSAQTDELPPILNPISDQLYSNFLTVAEPYSNQLTFAALTPSPVWSEDSDEYLRDETPEEMLVDVSPYTYTRTESHNESGQTKDSAAVMPPDMNQLLLTEQENCNPNAQSFPKESIVDDLIRTMTPNDINSLIKDFSTDAFDMLDEPLSSQSSLAPSSTPLSSQKSNVSSVPEIIPEEMLPDLDIFKRSTTKTSKPILKELSPPMTARQEALRRSARLKQSKSKIKTEADRKRLNREAAARCRARKLNAINELAIQKKTLTVEVDELNGKVRNLRNEVYEIKKNMLKHRIRGCPYAVQ